MPRRTFQVEGIKNTYTFLQDIFVFLKTFQNFVVLTTFFSSSVTRFRCKRSNIMIQISSLGQYEGQVNLCFQNNAPLWYKVARKERERLKFCCYCIQGKFRPRFIFALFVLWPEGKFKTGLIELCIKDYIRKLECGRIQEWANQSQNSIGRK